jgi:hypothetical protein
MEFMLHQRNDFLIYRMVRQRTDHREIFHTTFSDHPGAGSRPYDSSALPLWAKMGLLTEIVLLGCPLQDVRTQRLFGAW